MKTGSLECSVKRAPRDQVQLLVSVRDEREAESALAGGADWIDVKEPARGSLGAADVDTLRRVLGVVGGRRPVSAAVGEWDEPLPHDLPEDISFVKTGLAGAKPDWSDRVLEKLLFISPHKRIVAAYADYQRAKAPPVLDVVRWVCEGGGVGGVLIDTAVKDGSCLFDWMNESQLAGAIGEVRAAGLMIALAGSLRGCGLRRAAALGPDIVAVRSAVCVGGDRFETVDAACVRAVGDLVKHTSVRSGAAGLAAG